MTKLACHPIIESGAAVQLQLEPIRSIEEAAEDWFAVERLVSPSPFLSWAWIGTWLSLLPAAFAPSLLRATIDRRTVGLGIVIKRQQRRHFLIHSRGLHLNSTGDPDVDCISIEFNGFLAMPADTGILVERLIEEFSRGSFGGDEIYLPGVTWHAESDQWRHGKLGRRCVQVPYYFVDLAKLASSAGDVTAQLSRNARQKMRRAIRKMQEFGSLTVVEASSTDEALVFFDGMRQLHIASWERRNTPHAFTSPFFERFHTAMIRNTFSQGGLQLLKIAAGPHVFGYLYNLRRHGHVYAYQSGLADSVPNTHPGYVSHCLAIKHNFDQGVHVYDFLAGSNQLKRTLATHQAMMYWDCLQRPLLRFRAEAAARKLRQLVRERGLIG